MKNSNIGSGLILAALILFLGLNFEICGISYIPSCRS